MNPLTALVFILALGSANCDDSDETDPDNYVEIRCLKEEGITRKDLKKPDAQHDMRVKCFYHCQMEQVGLILRGQYHGMSKTCKGVKDANKCELGWKVHQCVDLSHINDK